MISTTAQYALRALTFLANIPKGESMLGQDLAKLTGIPANYLSKVLLTLKKAGILTAVRGVGGGYQLALPPGEIHLITIIELIDTPQIRTQCLLGQKERCSDGDPCTAHLKWGEVRNRFISFLENTTIQDISHNALVAASHREGNWQP